jgi:nucleoside-diphosphate-sugar epimerase
MGEMTLKAYNKQFGQKGVSCRLFTVYGPRESESHAITFTKTHQVTFFSIPGFFSASVARINILEQRKMELQVRLFHQICI